MKTRKSKNQSNYLTFCTIVKDEDGYLDEWLSFHLSVGVERFLIVDNSSRQSLNRTLHSYVASGVVEIRTFTRQKNQQREAFDRALFSLRNKSRWVGFFDVDEFVFPVKASSLPEVLRNYERYPALAVNWVAYGSNNHTTKPDEWVTTAYTDRGALEHTVDIPQLRLPGYEKGVATKLRPMNTHVKCFVDPRRTKFFRSAHHFEYENGETAVDENFRPVDGPFSKSVSVEVIRANHYWSKSLDELNEKLQKGRVSQSRPGRPSGYDREQAIAREKASGGEFDDSALRFVEKAREISSHHSTQTVGEPLPTPRRIRFGPFAYIASRWRHFKVTFRKQYRRVFR